MKTRNAKLLAVVFFAVWCALGAFLSEVVFAGVDATDNYLLVTDDLAAPEDFDLTSFGVTGTTSPGIRLMDDVPAIVFNDNERSTIQRSFTIPHNYPGGLAFQIMCSTSSTSTLPEIAWELRLNIEDTAFGSTMYLQTTTALSNTSSDTQNEMVTLRINSTAEAAIKSALKKGKRVFGTLGLNHTNTGSGTLEIKQVRKIFNNFK